MNQTQRHEKIVGLIKQHGFMSNRRLEEHLLTATFVFEKTLAANCPLWLLS